MKSAKQQILSTLLAAVLLVWSPAGAGAGRKWPGIRDGALYARMHGNAALRLKHRPAWGAEGSGDIFYFQAPDGDVLQRLNLEAGTPAGSAILRAARGDGDYRFEVTGYSHREAVVDADEGVALVFEPAKVHFSLNLPADSLFTDGGPLVLYFSVPDSLSGAERSFSLCGRYEKNGPDSLLLTSPGGKTRLLRLDPSLPYDAPEYSRLTLSGDECEAGVWSVSFSRGGKAAFWLDGIPNLFALTREDLFIPDLKDNSRRIRILPEIAGKTPLLGVTVISNILPEYEEQVRALAPEAINSYIMLRRHGQNARKLPSAQNPRSRVFMILDPQPDVFLDADALETRLPFFRPVDGTAAGDGAVAFYDEPNLRFPSAEAFTNAYFSLLADYARVPGLAGLPAAFPETSFLTDGPFTGDSARRRGLDWLLDILRDPRAAKLLRPPYVVSWHEWMHRDLLGTEYYAQAVDTAWAALRRLSPESSLNITQTNMSSGRDSSPYEENTFFASLWLASAYVRAAGTGRLDTFCWFALADEPGLHRKGLMSTEQNGTRFVFRPKPSWHAFAFLLAKKQPLVLRSEGGGGELAVLAVTDAAQKRVGLFIVNVARRTYMVTVETPGGTGAAVRADERGVLSVLTAANPEKPDVRTNVAAGSLCIGPESINFFEMTPAASQK